jgi:hypothetical protein
MSRSLGNGIASLGESFMRAYSAAQDRKLEAEKYADAKAWQEEQRGWERDRRAKELGIQTAQADAMAPAKVDNGYQVTGAGNDAYTQDPDAAAMMQDMGQSVAPAGQAVGMAPATRVQGKAYTDAAAAKTAQADYDRPSAQLGRAADATMKLDATKGTALKASAMQTRAAEITLGKAEQEEVNERFNTELLKHIQDAPTWYEGVANSLSRSQAGGLAGVQVHAVLSKDGKTVDMMAVTEDGKAQKVNTFRTDARGMRDFIAQASKSDAKTKLAYLSDNAKQLQAQEDNERERQDDLAKEQRGYAHDEKMVGIRAAARGGSGGSGGGGSRIDPQTVATLNELSARIDAEADPAKRRALENQYQRVYGLAATQMGKLVPPRAQRTETDPKKILDYAKTLVEAGGEDPDNPGKPLGLATAKKIAESEYSGQPYMSAADKLAQAYIEAKNAKRAPAEATPAGKQLLGLYGAMGPSKAPAVVAPVQRQPANSQERLRSLYLGNP